MQWREIIVHTTTDGADLLSELMMELGAAGTEIVDRADVPDPDKPGVYWELYDKKLLEEMPEDVLVKGWFARDEQEQQTIENLKARLEALKTDSFGVEMGSLRMDEENVKDEDWAEEWKKNYKPLPDWFSSGGEAHVGEICQPARRSGDRAGSRHGLRHRHP